MINSQQIATVQHAIQTLIEIVNTNSTNQQKPVVEKCLQNITAFFRFCSKQFQQPMQQTDQIILLESVTLVVSDFYQQNFLPHFETKGVQYVCNQFCSSFEWCFHYLQTILFSNSNQQLLLQQENMEQQLYMLLHCCFCIINKSSSSNSFTIIFENQRIIPELYLTTLQQAYQTFPKKTLLSLQQIVSELISSSAQVDSLLANWIDGWFIVEHFLWSPLVETKRQRFVQFFQELFVSLNKHCDECAQQLLWKITVHHLKSCQSLGAEAITANLLAIQNIKSMVSTWQPQWQESCIMEWMEEMILLLKSGQANQPFQQQFIFGLIDTAKVYLSCSPLQSAMQKLEQKMCK